MIKGTGIDIVEIKRIKKIIDKWGMKFSCRVFTHNEREYCEKKKYCYHSYAARFAAKESLLKALGIGLRGVSWKEIEITIDLFGKPEVKVYGKLKNILYQQKINNVFLTLSHSSKYAIAQVILEE
jgi:holo-[acyl-carrier protein] synthase